MFRSLHSKLLAFFLLLSLSGILLVSVAVYFGFQETFQQYLMNKREGQVLQVAEQLENELTSTSDGQDQWNGVDSSLIMMLNHLGMEEQLYFQVRNVHRELIIDTSEIGSTMEHHMMGGMRGSMPGNVNVSSQSFDEMEIPLEVNGGQVGTLTAFYPVTFINTDVEFLSQFTKYLIFASIIMTIIAVLLSYVFSKRLTKGLKQVSGATMELKDHHFDVQIPTKHHVQEIEQLAQGVNDLAASLKKSEELRKQFTSDLAHELRTPLATLRSQLESIQDGIFEPTQERLDQCHHELMRLVRLVNEMENLHAAENPNVQLNMQPLDSIKQLNALYTRFEPAFRKENIVLTIDEENSYSFMADPDRFTQVMTNLINNALKYTSSGGEVHLGVGQDKGYVYFTVKDNGQGISKEELAYVYERFFRGEKSRNRKTGGLGIGLSIVKALMDAHKGKIQINSEIQKGTTVKVSFPKK